jgi:TetR/AcrR family fatty acid metabolism transcriptional regulator
MVIHLGNGASSGGRRKTKRAASPVDKHERILRAAVRVFARKGFYATRVSEIAKAAGVADGTIYLYFKSKDDVLVSIFETHIRRLIVILREVAAADGTIEERFTKMIELQLGLLEEHRDLAEVITVNLRQSSKLLKQYAAPLFLEYLDVIAGVVAEGQRRGTFRDDVSPRTVARAAWGAFDGIALTWALSDADSGALRRAGQQLAAVFLQGLRRERAGR